MPSLSFPLATVRSINGRGGSGWKWGSEGCSLYWSEERGVVPDLSGGQVT